MIEDNETKSFLQAIIDNDDRIMYLVFSDGLLHEILNFVPENEDTSLELERISRDWENPSTYMEGKFSNKQTYFNPFTSKGSSSGKTAKPKFDRSNAKFF